MPKIVIAIIIISVFVSFFTFGIKSFNITTNIKNANGTWNAGYNTNANDVIEINNPTANPIFLLIFHSKLFI